MTRARADVTVTCVVRADARTAFEVFTEETDTWWRRSPRFRFRRAYGSLRFEPGVGGRLVETFPDGDSWEVGEVTAWEPGVRLAFDWRLSNFAEDESTRVEITFEAIEHGTRVVVAHHGLLALRKDHPARHGQDDEPYAARSGMWWGELLAGLREHVERRGSTSR